MRYQIIYKLYGTERDAERDLSKIKESAPDSYVLHSKKSGHWLIVLEDCKSQLESEKRWKYFHFQKGLQCFVRVDV